jgi:hypothetical protein
MSSTTAFRRLLNASCTLHRRLLDATNGDVTDTTVATVRCAFEYDRKRSVGRDGEQVLINAVVYLAEPTTGFDPTHELWEVTDSRFPDRRLQVVNVRVVDDQRTGATHHYELECL